MKNDREKFPIRNVTLAVPIDALDPTLKRQAVDLDSSILGYCAMYLQYAMYCYFSPLIPLEHPVSIITS